MEKDFLKPLIDDLKKLVSDYISQYCDAKGIQPGQISGLFDEKNDSPIRDHGLQIGQLEIANPVISAPLAGISDSTYRIFARSFGCGLTFSEMVTSYGIHFNHKKSCMLTEITDHERPCALQLFGSEPDIMAEAAKKVEEQADIIDINMGCPVPKILKAKSGGYLMQDESRVEDIVLKMAKVLKKPLTVKTRIGWDRDNINVIRIAQIAENSGASAITIHGRTVRQGFSGEADYETISRVKKKVGIPVIVSGDIGSSGEAQRVLEITGCDGVMIGRASKGTLWLFLDILMHLMMAEDYKQDADDDAVELYFQPTDNWKKDFARLYLRFLVAFKGEYRAIREFRKHLSWIFKGVRDITKARKRFFLIESIDNALEIIDSI
ncbi:MAG: tRNA dihydrouridine synthase DusB [Actinobacteria bacterium]|nr:tRNA dihydrouridine synthase DusB [Actinomycetota bacterium]